ncbi:MAG: DNA polymerase III subunit delta' [Chloroflexi bacterium]|nr:DNA polymerase III subunit delta' [Chloroflexota bacterium]
MWHIVGHEWAVALLSHSAKNGHPAHAYLLVGPSHIGKTTLALNYAQALNCLGSDVPCGHCLACRKIERGVHPDVRLMEPEGSVLKIDQVRALQHEVSLSPFEGRWRVYILPEFHRATTEAANCLLKTLEEPPPRVVIILTALRIEMLLPTVVSRCQVLSLRPLSLSQVQEALEAREVAPEAAVLLAHLSGGRIGWAIMAASNPALVERRARYLEMLENALERGRTYRMQMADQLSQHPENLPDILEMWLSWWRDVMLLSGGCKEEDIANLDRIMVLRQQAKRTGVKVARSAIQTLCATADRLEHNVNPRLAMEALLLSLPSLGA